MSADAKVWKDNDGWHGICDAYNEQLDESEYGLTDLLIDIEDRMEMKLDWEIFQFTNGPGLRGYRAKSS